DSEKLTHNQLIVIGWSKFIDEYLDAIAKEFHDI
ncbi:MAG: inositol monophosphatase family protein, partial [Pseudanabaena sp. M165S2SP1A06QC]|nr:inositol monophosphatase family protein [Pseudanabaena sp. M165S2SP1A06QC]